MPISTYTDGIGDAFRSIGEYAIGLVAPTVRLGVTGLARSGKTVFLTALVHNLIAGARLPFFDPAAEGRLVRAYLEPQPDDVVPRFDYETHLADLTASPPRAPQPTALIVNPQTGLIDFSLAGVPIPADCATQQEKRRCHGISGSRAPLGGSSLHQILNPERT